MDNEVNYTIVGAFVITLTIAMVITIIWLSSGLKFTQYSNYLVYSKESVSGLNVDSTVEYNGVNVGTVKKISLDPRDPRVVILLISLDSNTKVTRGTVATLTTRGITGVVFLALKDTGHDLRPLLASEGESYPVIPTTPSLFTRLDIALTRITNNFDTLANAFKSLLDKHNLDSISQSLDNIDRITTGLAGSTNKFSSIINNTESASQQFLPLINNTKSTMRSLETQTLPSIYNTINTMNDLMKNLNDVSQKLKQNPAVIIRGTAPSPLGPGERR